MKTLSAPKTLAAMIITIVSTAIVSPDAQASTYRHIDRLAVRLQDQAREMIGEFRLHYRHTGDYGHLVSDAYEIYRLAAHIHEVIHHDDNLHHVRADIKNLDRKFHHLEDLVAHIDRHPRGGHIHGNTFHVRELLAAMEDTLHHLQDDVDDLTDPYHRHTQKVVVPPTPVYQGHGHGHRYGGGGIRFGNDRISIRFSW